METLKPEHLNQIIENVKVAITQSVKETEDHDSIELEIEYDFSGVTLQQLIAYAVQQLRIKRAAKCRKMGSEWMQAHKKQTVTVAEDFGRKAAVPKEVTLKNFITGLSDAEKAAFLKDPEGFLNKRIATSK